MASTFKAVLDEHVRVWSCRRVLDATVDDTKAFFKANQAYTADTIKVIQDSNPQDPSVRAFRDELLAVFSRFQAIEKAMGDTITAWCDKQKQQSVSVCTRRP